MGNFQIVLIEIVAAVFVSNAYKIENDPVSLYSAKAPIVQTNGVNFKKTVLDHEKSFLVEYYASWCPHCIRFAPKMMELSREIYPWKDIVEIVTLNCALKQNKHMCMENDIKGFPTFKYFHFNEQHLSGSVELVFESREKLKEQLANAIAINLADDWKNAHHEGWPNFSTLSDTASVGDVLERAEKNSPKAKYVALYFVDKRTDGYILLLDFSAVKEVNVQLATVDHPLFQKFGLNTSDALVVFKMPNKKPIFISERPMNETEAVLELSKLTHHSPPKSKLTDKEIYHTLHPKPPKDFNRNVQYQVTAPDLLFGVGESIVAEIGMRRTLSGKSLRVARDYIKVIAKYFPSNIEEGAVNQLTRGMSDWLTEMSADGLGEVTNQQYEQKFQELNTTYEVSHGALLACKGCLDIYRGYPCTLWTLFHTLLVNAYQIDGHKADFDAKSAIEPLHEYVREFFGCRECAKHFDEFAKQISEAIQQPEDAVKFMWKGHNRANFITKDSKSSDPWFPKQQFPPTNLCPHCRLDHANAVDPKWTVITWNDTKVFDFLVDFYSNIDNTTTFKKVERFEDHVALIKKEEILCCVVVMV